MNAIEEKCRWEDCTAPATMWVAWQPFRPMDDHPELLDEVTITEVNQAVVDGVIEADWLMVCTKHQEDAVVWFREFQFPEDAISDSIYVGQVTQVVRVQRPRLIQEKIEILDMESGTTRTHPEPEGVEAPYGFKKDGVTPRSKPGRKSAVAR